MLYEDLGRAGVAGCLRGAGGPRRKLLNAKKMPFDQPGNASVHQDRPIHFGETSDDGGGDQFCAELCDTSLPVIQPSRPGNEKSQGCSGSD
jgi:hypothetical protein